MDIILENHWEDLVLKMFYEYVIQVLTIVN